MKSKNRRKNEKKFLDLNAIMVKCKNCKDFNKCSRKDNKMRDEKKGIRTFCTLSPNEYKKTLGKLTMSKTKISHNKI